MYVACGMAGCYAVPADDNGTALPPPLRSTFYILDISSPRRMNVFQESGCANIEGDRLQVGSQIVLRLQLQIADLLTTLPPRLTVRYLPSYLASVLIPRQCPSSFYGNVKMRSHSLYGIHSFGAEAQQCAKGKVNKEARIHMNHNKFWGYYVLRGRNLVI